MTRRSRYLDPAGAVHGIPTYPWRMAPTHLATRTQIRQLGFRPVAGPAAQLMWAGRPGRRRPGADARTAALFDLAATVQRTTASLRRHEQLADARARRRICPDCRRDAGYVIPAHLGCCLDCQEGPAVMALTVRCRLCPEHTVPVPADHPRPVERAFELVGEHDDARHNGGLAAYVHTPTAASQPEEGNPR